MAKKQDSYYFENFIECSECGCRASKLLEEIMVNFDKETVREKLDEMHAIEHEADIKKHEMLDILVKAFITPIEREDIIQVSQNIDEITDKIEDVLIRLYYNHIKTMRPDALELVKVVAGCCEEVNNLMKSFADFKKAKNNIHESIIRINSLEEEADKLYISCMYELHRSSVEIFDIVAWREIYNYLERCADSCEHVADIVESVVMKNS